MRILLVASTFPPKSGGIGVLNWTLASRLSSKGHELQVATWIPASTTGAHSSFVVHRLRARTSHRPYSCSEMPAILERFRPEAAIVSHPDRKMLLLYRILREYKTPYVAYCHKIQERYAARSRLKKFLIRRRHRFDGFPLLFTVSRSVADHLVELGVPEEKLRVLYPGVDPERCWLQPVDRAAWAKKLGVEGMSVLLTVARLVDGKGHERVLKVLPRLLESHPQLLYLIVGDGPIRSDLEKLSAELQISDHVRFIGLVADPRPYYAVADIFAHPSNMPGVRVEAFGLSMLEAGASGVPVIASKAGGASEIVIDGRTGLLIGDDDSNELENAFLCLLGNRELMHEYGRAAQEQVQSKFTWDRAIAQLESALEEVISAAQPAFQ